MKKRSQAEIDRAAADFADRLDHLESAWGARVTYEADLETGRAWFRLTLPGETVALHVRCSVFSVTLPASGE